jgi:hypothetical protein
VLEKDRRRQRLKALRDMPLHQLWGQGLNHGGHRRRGVLRQLPHHHERGLVGVYEHPQPIDAVRLPVERPVKGRQMVKEHYLGFVSETFPDLLPRYARAYASTNIAADYQTAIERRLAQIRGHHGFVEDALIQRRVEIGNNPTGAKPFSNDVDRLPLPL